jgi:hypothetical protein
MNRTLRVLNIEDAERDATLINRHLSLSGYDLVSQRVDTPVDLREALRSSEWDVILCG